MSAAQACTLACCFHGKGDSVDERDRRRRLRLRLGRTRDGKIDEVVPVKMPIPPGDDDITPIQIIAVVLAASKLQGLDCEVFVLRQKSDPFWNSDQKKRVKTVMGMERTFPRVISPRQVLMSS